MTSGKETNQKSQTTRLMLESNAGARTLYGEYNGNLKLIQRRLGVDIRARGNELVVSGEPAQVSMARKVLLELYQLVEDGYSLYPKDVEMAVRAVDGEGGAPLKEIFEERISVPSKKCVVVPKSLNQKRYVEAIRKHDLVFGIGPAGTGKTYLAMAMAVSALAKSEVSRIVLARPAVEAGEKLGFLPGDLYEKVDPYLRPLYDALHDMMDYEYASRSIHKGTIEVAPLAYMRGRTLNDSFIVLDEAQNSTTEQMKMFLTRLGFGSKAVVTGDITQIDLPSGTTSGLVEAKNILGGIRGIQFVFFSREDVVRHRIVQDIIDAYEKMNQGRAQARRHGEAEEAPETEN